MVSPQFELGMPQSGTPPRFLLLSGGLTVKPSGDRLEQQGGKVGQNQVEERRDEIGLRAL